MGLARDAVAAGARLVFAAGGDGTVRACAQALACTGVPLAIVALGTANLAARALGVPFRLDAALAAGFGGRPAGSTRSVVVGNAGLLPGGFVLPPDARLDDGVLDAGILAPSDPLGWARAARRVLTSSRRTDRHLERYQARRIEIHADAVLPREVDGEVIPPSRSLTVTLRQGALLVRVTAR